MKKGIGILIVLAVAAFVGVYAFTNIIQNGIGKVTGSSLETPDYSYELDTWKENSEIYEFTSKTDPNMVTIMFMLDNGMDVAIQTIPKSNDPSLSNPKKGNLSLQSPLFSYEIDTYGTNSEVYEFAPQSRLDWVCTMLMLDSGNSMDLACRPNSNYNKSPKIPVRAYSHVSQLRLK